MLFHEQFMRRALELAGRGKGQVLPNPMVGALIVREGKVLGEGWHARYGGIHAEAAALEDCREDPKGGTLYVTLEPCCHRGEGKHNPPCTELLLEAGISRVVIARSDPNPQVSGKGIQFLRERGVAVSSGLLERDAAELNRVYETLIRQDRPYVHLKGALSLDGFLAASDGSSRWISGEESRAALMRFRSESDAILTGRGTLFADHPSLTVRVREGEERPEAQPHRVFLSSAGVLPPGWKKEGGPVLVYYNKESALPAEREEPFQYSPVTGDASGLCLEEVLSDLRKREVYQLLVEGGSKVFGSFLRKGLWDRITLFLAPILLGRGVPFSDGLDISSLPDKLTLQDKTVTPSGGDVMINAYREAVTCLPV